MNIVFLDIDGVLQPYDSNNRFYEINKNTKKLINDLSEKHNIDYNQYVIYDVLAAYYDWHPQAISRLKAVLDATDSKIIASTDWKSERFPNKIHDLLELHDLGKYWYKDNIIIKDTLPFPKIRNLEILNSLQNYPIDNFVVLDDMKELKEYYPHNSVITNNYISVNNMEDCIKILKKIK